MLRIQRRNVSRILRHPPDVPGNKGSSCPLFPGRSYEPPLAFSPLSRRLIFLLALRDAGCATGVPIAQDADLRATGTRGRFGVDYPPTYGLDRSFQRRKPVRWPPTPSPRWARSLLARSVPYRWDPAGSISQTPEIAVRSSYPLIIHPLCRSGQGDTPVLSNTHSKLPLCAVKWGDDQALDPCP
jgi:hypothetical protein